jgi:chromosome segregation ATPase
LDATKHYRSYQESDAKAAALHRSLLLAEAERDSAIAEKAATTDELNAAIASLELQRDDANLRRATAEAELDRERANVARAQEECSSLAKNLADLEAKVKSDAEAGFNEIWYLERYPDVKNAVMAGKVPSGRWHFEARGRAEGRLGRPAE